jgi:hypothetical protein
VTPQEQMYLDEQKKIVQQKVEEENRARAEGRAGLVNFAKQKFYEATGHLIILVLQMVVEYNFLKEVNQKILVEENF